MVKNLNNKGFIFIETICMAVLLLTALILLYKSYSNVIINEQKKIYYDDVAFVYHTLTIRDIFQKSVNNNLFEEAVNNNNMYVYFFNINSPIYNSNSDMVVARDFFNFYQLAYIKLDDLKALNACLNNRASGFNATKCTNTKNRISGYSNTNLMDYLKTLDVNYDTDPSGNNYEGHKGILVSIFYFTKNGNKIEEDVINTAFGKYEECLDNEIYSFYAHYYFHLVAMPDGTYTIPSTPNANLTKRETAKKLYAKNSELNFSVRCAYAYYYSWVYL